MVEVSKLPKKIRIMDREELIQHISEKLKLEHKFLLYRFELNELQYLFFKISKYGKNLSNSYFLAGAILF